MNARILLLVGIGFLPSLALNAQEAQTADSLAFAKNKGSHFQKLVDLFNAAAITSVDEQDLEKVLVGRRYFSDKPDQAVGSFNICSRRPLPEGGPLFSEDGDLLCVGDVGPTTYFDEGVKTASLLQPHRKYTAVTFHKGLGLCQAKANSTIQCFRKSGEFIVFAMFREKEMLQVGYYFKEFAVPPNLDKLTSLAARFIHELAEGTKLTLLKDIFLSKGIRRIATYDLNQTGPDEFLGHLGDETCAIISKGDLAQNSRKGAQWTLLSSAFAVAQRTENKERGWYRYYAVTTLTLKDENGTLWTVACVGSDSTTIIDYSYRVKPPKVLGLMSLFDVSN